jgi:hypothetical protein
MAMQVIAFPPDVRKHLAALHLAAEKGDLSAADYETESAQIISEAATALGIESTYQTGPTPPEKDHPTGRQGCWWRIVGKPAPDLSGVIAAAQQRLAEKTT